MGAQGTATIDFGAFPGTTDAFVAVTGQAGILSGSLVEAWLLPAATAVHSSDEHYMASVMMDILAGEIIAGTGFTIRAIARDLGGQKLEKLGARRVNSVSGGMQFGEPADPSVGGQCLNRIWGTFNVAWVWN